MYAKMYIKKLTLIIFLYKNIVKLCLFDIIKFN